MNLDELQNLVSEEDIQRSLDDQIFSTLTFEQPNRVSDAISSAVTWAFCLIVEADMLKQQFSPDQQEIMKHGIVKRTIYEMYSTAEMEGSGEDKKKDAYKLIGTLLKLQSSDADTSGKRKTSKASISRHEYPYAFSHFISKLR